MSTVNINIRTDSELKLQAGRIFESLGLDMTTAINLFLRQTVREQDLPFILSTKPAPTRAGNGLVFGRGSMKGKMWVADDFDAPLDDFKEYME
ncbi:MAG: type II toxin-antitoxin system RelB/DinJ family antitoxin [Clostridiales Family XIII bacterium]|jgi:DNA-damage-inducible protein J|nr:type II toxin-antitoxin system RelB/DinJ family antitoxin [Clostridiales Family XIII bacterium]